MVRTDGLFWPDIRLLCSNSNQWECEWATGYNYTALHDRLPGRSTLALEINPQAKPDTPSDIWF